MDATSTSRDIQPAETQEKTSSATTGTVDHVDETSVSHETGSNTHRIGPIVLTIISAILLWDALGTNLGSLARPGAGLWPAISSATALLCSAVSIFIPNDGAERLQNPGLKRALFGMALLAGFVFTVGSVGFIIPSILLLLFFTRYVAGEGWKMSILMSVAVSSICFYIFSELLGMYLTAF